MWATCAARPTTSGCGTFWLFSPPSPRRELRLPGKIASVNSMLLLCYVFPRIVCEQLLRHLDMSNVLFWGEALSTVRAIVGGVDYKVSHSLPLPARGAGLSPPPSQGCRDLMKLLFDRFHRVPRSLPSSQLPALRRGRDLLAYILDRNAALLPAYFAYDEICRHYPDKTRPPHWLLQEAISPLHSSMQTLADLVHILTVGCVCPSVETCVCVQCCCCCCCVPAGVWGRAASPAACAECVQHVSQHVEVGPRQVLLCPQGTAALQRGSLSPSLSQMTFW